LAITALATIASAAHTLWTGLAHWTIATETLRVLDQLLIVLMLVEILHTVRISIRSNILLAAEPFLVVGLIASIRRVLIISLQMTALTREGKWSTDGASIFQSSMIELALLGSSFSFCSQETYGGLAMTTRPTHQAAPETSRARLTYLELQRGTIHVLR
jgi:Phosphate-starvation-inducible E family